MIIHIWYLGTGIMVYMGAAYRHQEAVPGELWANVSKCIKGNIQLPVYSIEIEYFKEMF